MNLRMGDLVAYDPDWDPTNKKGRIGLVIGKSAPGGTMIYVYYNDKFPLEPEYYRDVVKL